jgi:acetyl-CoA carboxylase carboxyl transferase subunit alpha
MRARGIPALPMNPNFLDFEQPIAELEAKIEELRLVGNDNEINIGPMKSRSFA